jgi:hypothetical protein
MPGRFKPDEITPVQEAFFVGLTDQRVANIWAAADDWAELSPDAKNLLRNAEPATMKWLERASKEDIAQLQYSIRFMSASKLLGSFVWYGMLGLVGAAVLVLQFGEKVKSFFGTKP